MLENPSLWLSALTAAWPSDLPRMGRLIRHILEAYTRESLGYAAITSGRWWPYRKRLVAYEVPDGSLLFSVRPGGWFRSALVVAEADAKTVALIQGECLLGPSRQILAR